MVKLIADLALSRTDVDRSVALGEAVPRLERLRKTILWGLTAAVVILSAGYIHLAGEMNVIQNQQRQSHDRQKEILSHLKAAEARITVLVAGKSGASPQIQP